MARKPLPDSGAKAQLNSNTGDLVKAALIPITQDGKLDTSKEGLGKFLLNPSSWQESKSSNWAPQNVPGQSHPVKQWVAGGSRIVSFDVLVTRDTSDLGRTSPSALQNIKDAALNVVSEVASDFFGANVPPLQDLFNSGGSGSGGVLSIQEILDYYRSLTLPLYSENNELLSSPPLLALFVGSTLSHPNTEMIDSLKANSQVWTLEGLNINITKQLPNLAPMEAIVNFKLEQYIISSVSSNFAADNNSSSATNLVNAFSGIS